MTETDTTTGKPDVPGPEEIGFLVKTFRIDKGWTQETLAALSGLQTRTIQRVEQGQPSSFDTRRALGRAFAFPDIDFFNTLRRLPSEEEQRKQQEAFDRDYVLLDAQVVSGRQLFMLMQGGPSLGAICPASTTELPRAAQDAFAVIADYVRDCVDILDDVPQRELLTYGDELDENITVLNNAGFCLCAAFRDTSMTSKSWVDKAPLPFRITYLIPGPKDHPPAKVAVNRKWTWA